VGIADAAPGDLLFDHPRTPFGEIGQARLLGSLNPAKLRPFPPLAPPPGSDSKSRDLSSGGTMPQERKIRSAFAAALLLSACATPASVPGAPPASAARAAALRRIPALMDEALVPGLQVAVISDGRVEVHNFGVRDVQTGAPVTADTVFEAASLGKPVFAYGLLKLADAGRLDLDAPIGRYVPDLAAPLRPLTAGQLLTHRGGLPNGGQGSHFADPVSPGERFSYSGQGFLLLQKVVERITAKPLQAYMQEAVFAPLGMTHSSYVWRSDYEERKAFGHGPTGSSAGRNRIAEARAASSLETNAADYARFLLALVRGSGLSSGLASQALEPQAQVERGCAVCLWHSRGAPYPGIAWGLGVGLAETPAGRVVWHWGENETMQAYAALTLDGRRGVVILTDSANGHSIARAIASSLLGFDAPGYDWLGSYTPYTDPSRRLLSQLVHGRGVPTLAGLRRADVVEVAERLLAGDRPAEAAALAARLPGGPADAAERALMAEALRRAGRFAEARAAAEAALRLEPADGRAAETLKRLKLAERSVPPRLLALYAGRYETPFGLLDVTSDGRRLTARLQDRPPSPTLPMSDSLFLMEGMEVPIEFVLGADGGVSHAIVHANPDVRLKRLD
jgi:CubicO group peptidase (beta-lactamase class C family)